MGIFKFISFPTNHHVLVHTKILLYFADLSIPKFCRFFEHWKFFVEFWRNIIYSKLYAPEKCFSEQIFFFKKPARNLHAPPHRCLIKHTLAFISACACAHTRIFLSCCRRAALPHMFTRSTCITHIAHAFVKAAGGIVMSLSAWTDIFLTAYRALFYGAYDAPE